MNKYFNYTWLSGKESGKVHLECSNYDTNWIVGKISPISNEYMTVYLNWRFVFWSLLWQLLSLSKPEFFIRESLQVFILSCFHKLLISVWGAHWGFIFIINTVLSRRINSQTGLKVIWRYEVVHACSSTKIPDGSSSQRWCDARFGHICWCVILFWVWRFSFTKRHTLAVLFLIHTSSSFSSWSCCWRIIWHLPQEDSHPPPSIRASIAVGGALARSSCSLCACFLSCEQIFHPRARLMSLSDW